MSKTIFITGIAGFLGSHLADRFIAQGYRVKGNDNLIGGYLTNVPAQAEFFQVDCNDHSAMVECLKGTDILIHTAATAYEGLSVFSPNFIVNNTLQASVSTISAAIQNRVQRIIYCSSMARYGDQPTPFLESYCPQPLDPYAVAKVAGENILKKLCDLNNISWNIVVPHNIIGPRQKYDDPFRNVVSIMINRCLQNKPPVIYGNGEQKRCFSYIDDCLFCLEKIVLDSNINHTVINIGPDEEFVTINELAKLVIELTNSKLEPMYVGDRPLEVRYATCNADLARSLLGYKTSTTLRQALQKSIEWIQQQGPKPFVYEFPVEIQNELTPVTWIRDWFNQ